MNIRENKYYTLTGHHQRLDENDFPVVAENSPNIYARQILEKKPRSMIAKSQLGVDNIGYKYYIATNHQRQAYNPLSKTYEKKTFVDRICKNNNIYNMLSLIHI